MALKPETMLSGSAELDFRFLSAEFLAGMHTCYPKLKLSTSAANYSGHKSKSDVLVVVFVVWVLVLGWLGCFT